jgi:hypothetical protein
MIQKYPQQKYIYTGSKPERNLGDSSLESDSSIIENNDEQENVNENDLIMTENFFEIPKEREIPCINIPFNDKEISPQNKQGMIFCSATKDTENECLRKNSNNKNDNFSIKKKFNFINENNRYNISKLFKKNCHFFTSLQNDDDDESDEDDDIVNNEITINFNNGFNVDNNEIIKNKINNNNSNDKFKKDAQFEIILEPNISKMDSNSEISIRNINKINAMNRYENETSEKENQIEKEKENEKEIEIENKDVMENTMLKKYELETNIKRIIENINRNKSEWNKNKLESNEINIENKDNNGEDYFIENKENYGHNGLFDKEIKLNTEDIKNSSNSKFLGKNNKSKIINIERDINVNLNNIFFELKNSKKSNDISISKSKSYKSSSMKKKRGRKIFNLSKKYKIFHNFLSVGIDTSGLYTLDDTMKSLILNPKITYNYPLNNLEKDLE